jgi:RNA ligase
MKINIPQEMIDDDYISVTKHYMYDLFIYNYTRKTQYEQYWNEYTKICRGLILDSNNNIVARPFKKFFNLEELNVNDIPKEEFEVFEKMDGSLGIIYQTDSGPYIATRGSFISEQADKANRLLYTKYKNCLSLFKKNVTYLVEIIYPENRIIVDYGNIEDLILLAVIDNETGKDLPLDDIGLPIVRKYYGIKDYTKCKRLNWEDKEGFVIKFKNDYRMKIKFDEYIRLHRLITRISNKDIWEYLRINADYTEILDRVPDEFDVWVRKTVETLNTEYDNIETYLNDNFKVLSNRKLTAEYFLKLKYSSLFFMKLDNKDYKETIWKLVKPKYEKPFVNNIT